MRHRLGRCAVAAASGVAGVALIAACSTTLDSGITAPPPGPALSTTVFTPAGSTAAILDQLLDEAATLSEAIVENDGQGNVMARIDALWAAVRPDIDEAVSAAALADFDRTIELLRNGVERRRPADADKAHNNLRTLVAALPEQLRS